MKKRVLITYLLLLLLTKVIAQDSPKIYLTGLGGASNTGTVTVRIFNASYDASFTFDVSTEVASPLSIKPPVGRYNISITNNSNGNIFHNICQIGGICNTNYLKQNMCGYGADNPAVYNSQIGTATGATKTVYSNLNLLSKPTYGTTCVTKFSSIGGDYELGAVYINLIVDERNICRGINYLKPSVTTNAEMINDSTYQIATNSVLKLNASCSSVITGYKAEWGTTGLDSLKEVISTNKTYQVRCKDTGTCNTSYRNIYVNVFNSCTLSSNNSSVTGIVLNNNYTGPFVFEILAPPPTGSVSGTYEVSDGTNVWLTGSFNQLRYDASIGAYHIETNSWVGGSVATPEKKSGYIKVKIGSQQTYKVNYHYTSFGAFMAGNDSSMGYNTVKPQGLSVTYSSCFDGKSQVYGNSEAKIQDNNYSNRTINMRLREISPAISSDLVPLFERKFEFNANGQDGYDGGAVWSLGQKITGQTYTFRVIGTSINAESVGDFSDISFTPTCPNPQASSSKSIICLGESSTLAVTGCTGNICWETGQTTQTIIVKPTLTSSYKVACTTIDGDYSSATIMVTVLNNNTILSIISDKPNNSITPNQQISLTASGCSNGQIVWANGFIGSTQIVSPSVTTDYFAYCEIGSCRSSVSTIKVVVAPPTPSIISNNAEFCETSSNNVILSASGCNGTYFWSTGATTDIIQVPAQTNMYWVVCRIGGVDSEKKHIKLKY
jgi:hypothetical protein